MAVEVGTAYVSIVPSAKGFVGTLQKDIGGGLGGAGTEAGKTYGNSMMSSIRTAAKGLATMFAVGGAVDFFKGAVTGASDLQETTTKIQAVFGGASGAVQAFAGKGAKALGQTKQQVLDSAASFGVFGKAAGLTGPGLAGFSTELTGLSTDLGSFFNTNPADAAAAISAGLRGESEPLRQYGVLLDDATLRNEAVKQGLIKTTKEALTPQQKVLAAHAVILAQTKDAQGDFARTSGGLANQQRILSAQFKDTQTKIGGLLLPVITTLVSVLNNNLGPAIGVVVAVLALLSTHFIVAGVQSVIATAKIIGSWIASGAAAVASGAETAAVWAMYAVEWVKSGVQSVIGAAKVVGAWVAQSAAAVAHGVVAAGVWVAEKARWVAGGVQSAIGAAKIVASWVAQSAAAVAHGVVAAAVWVAGAVVAGVQMAITVASVVGGWIVIGVQSLIGAAQVALAWIIAFWPIALVIALVIGLVIIIVKNWDTIKAKTAAIWGAITGFISGAWDTIKGAVSGAVDAVKRWISSAWDAVKQKTSDAWNGLKGAVSGAIGGVVGVVSGLPGQIMSALGNLGSLLVSAGGSLISGLINGIRNAGGALMGFIVQFMKDHVPGPILAFFHIGSPSKLMADIGKQIPAGFALGIASGASDVEAAVSAMMPTVNGLGGGGSLAVTGRAGAVAGLSGGGPLIAVYPQAGQSEEEIASIAAGKLMFHLVSA